MIYSELTNKAMKIAYEAHELQKDTGGIPYIFHPYHLAEQMNTETRCCIALLHDVAEDTDVKLEELEKEFPTEVIEALNLLTHRQDEDYFDYVRGICKNKDASFVKLADLIHNMDETRLCGLNLSVAEKDRWIVKYAKALQIVTGTLEQEILVDSSDSSGDSDRELLNRLLGQYRYPDRLVKIDCGKDAVEYITKEQFQLLSGLTIEEQMELLYIDTNQKEISDYQYLGSNKKLYSERLDGYKFNKCLLVVQDVIVGILRINNQCSYKGKNRVSFLWINGNLEVEEYRYIDHSRDHMAVGQQIDVCHLYMDTALARVKTEYELEYEFDVKNTRIQDRYDYADSASETSHHVIKPKLAPDNIIRNEDGTAAGVKYMNKELYFDDTKDEIIADYKHKMETVDGNYPFGAYTREITEIQGMIRLKRRNIRG